LKPFNQIKLILAGMTLGWSPFKLTAMWAPYLLNNWSSLIRQGGAYHAIMHGEVSYC